MEVVGYIGRFNPITLGHDKVFKQMIEISINNKIKPCCFIVDGTKSSNDKARNPLSSEFRQHICSKYYPMIKFDIISTAYDIFDVLEIQNFKMTYFMCGVDRKESYIKMFKHNEYTTNIIHLNRSDYSATKARELALKGKFEEFILQIPSFDSSDICNIYNTIRG